MRNEGFRVSGFGVFVLGFMVWGYGLGLRVSGFGERLMMFRGEMVLRFIVYGNKGLKEGGQK